MKSLDRATPIGARRRIATLIGASVVTALLCQSSAYGDGANSKKDIVRIEPAAALEGFEPLTAFAMPGKPVPAAASREAYKGVDGLRVGIWEGEPGILQLKAYPFDEFCLLVGGELVITGADGKPQTYRKGDSFVIPKGFSGTWEMKTKVRKQSVLVAAPPAAR